VATDFQTADLAPGESGGPKYRRILIVEDDPTLRHLVSRNLASRGHLVLEAESAAEAASAIRAERPDLILLDINLPDRTGWDVLRELRNKGIAIPTVVVSAVRVSPNRLAEFRPLGYLPKPFPLEALLRLVDGESPPGEPSPMEARP
jgi:DNA-binding response OmpR family regulator